MIVRLQSGYQHGADMGGVHAAVSAGIPVSGWMPCWFATEGRGGGAVEWHPEYAELYGARELEPEWRQAKLADQYRERTRRNASEAEVTLWFGTDSSLGYAATRKAAHAASREFVRVHSKIHTPDWMAHWLRANRFESINCAGNRASISPLIMQGVFRYLSAVFDVTQKGAS